jgi:hypothetical protein
MPFNVGFLQLINGIANSRFKGYWVGGDYDTFFRSTGPITERTSDAPLRAILAEDGSARVIDFALGMPANVTCDVDPALLRFAQARGLRREFVGRMGHFIDLVNGQGGLTLKEDLVAETQDLSQRLDSLSSEELPKVYDHIRRLAYLFSGITFNWIYATANIPPLMGNTNTW